MSEAPRIYDIKIDDWRPVTQADANLLMSVSLTTGLMRRAIYAIMRLQFLLPNGLVDKEEVVAAIAQLERVALMPMTPSAGKYGSLYFDEGEIEEIRKNKEEA